MTSTITETSSAMLRRISALQRAGAAVEIVTPDPAVRPKSIRAKVRNWSRTTVTVDAVAIARQAPLSARTEQAIDEWKQACR